MTDLPDDEPTTDDVDQPARLALPSLDSFRAVRDLVALAIDPRAVKRNLRSLHDALVATAAAQRKLESDRAAFDEYEQTTRAELTAQATKLREGQVALATTKDRREDDLREREQRIGELERRWAFIGEDDDVRSGFRTAEFGALYKARSAHGYASDAVAGLDDIAEQMREKYPSSTVVRTGTAGEEFPKHVSLTRTPEQPPAGARIRGRKHSPPLPGPEAA